jgi:preprotein translocase subunit YajC
MYTNTAPSPLFFLQDGGAGGFASLLVPMILMFGIFYFLVIRPQQKRQRVAQQERDRMLSALKPGDKVVTSSGIYGTIVAVRDEKVQVKIAQSVAVEMQKSAVTGFQTEGKEAEAAKQ